MTLTLRERIQRFIKSYLVLLKFLTCPYVIIYYYIYILISFRRPVIHALFSLHM